MAHFRYPERADKRSNYPESLMQTTRTKYSLSDSYLTKTGNYVPVLTGLRAVSAYLVFLHHYNPALPNTFVNRLLAQGYIGVSVFFVLSGFLIYHRYTADYFKRESWLWRRYLQNRFARIFPLYALLLIITVGVDSAMGRTMSWPVFMLNISLVKGFFDTYKFSGIAQSWSLTVELCFYLSAPLLFVTLQRLGAFVITVGLVSAGLLGWVAMAQLTGYSFTERLPFFFFYTFFGRVVEFVAGMWLARRWQKNELPAVRYATGAGLIVMSSCVLWQALASQSLTSPAGLLLSEIIVYNTVLPIGIGLLFMGLLREKSCLKSFLSQPVMQSLGHSSYAFYLIHIGVAAGGLQRAGVTNHWLLFGLLVLLAHGLYNFVEKPLQRYFTSE